MCGKGPKDPGDRTAQDHKAPDSFACVPEFAEVKAQAALEEDKRNADRHHRERHVLARRTEARPVGTMRRAAGSRPSWQQEHPPSMYTRSGFPRLHIPTRPRAR